jgi:hypothetical protein
VLVGVHVGPADANVDLLHAADPTGRLLTDY